MRREERLFALLSLVCSRRAISFAEIRDAMSEDYGGNPGSARRKFERDKLELAELGFALRYDGVRNLYAPPEEALRRRGLALTGEEAALCRLALAVAAADPGSPLRADAVGCLARLARVVAPSADAPAPPLRVHHPTREEAPDLADNLRRLSVATWRRLPVRFSYRREDGGPRRTRDVEPWGLFARDGRWYLVGWDRMRDDERTFRLARMRRLHVEGLPDGAPRFGVPASFDVAKVAARAPWDWSVHAPVEAVLRVDEVVADAVARALGGDATVEDGERVRRTVTHASALTAFAVERLPRVHVEAPEPTAGEWRALLHAASGRHA